MAKKLKPLADRLIVERIEEDNKTKGGIIIPDNAKEKSTEAMVVAVGPGKILNDGSVRPVDIKVGERVLIGKYGGTEVKVDGKDLLIIREDEVLGVIG